MALLSEQDRKRVEGWAADEWMLTGYAHIQGTRPQTLAYGLLDSPVALAGWITEKFREWTQNDGDLRDVVSWDDLLTNISLYWFTGTIGTSARLYREHFDLLRQGILPRARCEVPTGLAIYPGELWLQPRAWAEREYDLVHWYDAPRGGHFAALEQPVLFSADLWSFHRTIRALRHAKT
jgi:microsomal epoxide hydrolase